MAKPPKHHGANGPNGEHANNPSPLGESQLFKDHPDYLASDYDGPTSADERRDLLLYLGVPLSDQKQCSDAELDDLSLAKLAQARDAKRLGQQNFIGSGRQGLSASKVHSSGIAESGPTVWIERHKAEIQVKDTIINTLAKKLVATQETAPEIAKSKSEHPEPPVGYLGLRLDHSRHVVNREGYPALSLAHSPLRFALLAKLVHNRDATTNRDALAAVWKERGTDDAPSDERIDGEISNLRRELSALGLKIVNRRRLGWLIQEELAT